MCYCLNQIIQRLNIDQMKRIHSRKKILFLKETNTFFMNSEKLVPMTETQILINVTNTGDKNQTFHVELFDSSGYLVETVDKDLLLKSQESREINVIMNATSSELTYVS